VDTKKVYRARFLICVDENLDFQEPFGKVRQGLLYTACFAKEPCQRVIDKHLWVLQKEFAKHRGSAEEPLQKHRGSVEEPLQNHRGSAEKPLQKTCWILQTNVTRVQVYLQQTATAATPTPAEVPPPEALVPAPAALMPAPPTLMPAPAALMPAPPALMPAPPAIAAPWHQQVQPGQTPVSCSMFSFILPLYFMVFASFNSWSCKNFLVVVTNDVVVIRFLCNELWL
jgi:hypothetical protein